MFSRKALCTMVILVGCCLIGSPSALASKSKIIEELLSIFGASSKSPVKHPQAPVNSPEQLPSNSTELPGKPPKSSIELLNLRNLSEDDFKKRPIGILDEYGDASLKTTLREWADAVWSDKIFPAVEEKWKFDPNNFGKVKRKILQDICTRAYMRSIEKEDFIKEIIGLGLEKTDNKLLGEALFVVELANPELTRKDALCLLRTKVTEEMLEQAASIWRKFAYLSHCLKTIMNKAPLANDCR